MKLPETTQWCIKALERRSLQSTRIFLILLFVVVILIQLLVLGLIYRKKRSARLATKQSSLEGGQMAKPKGGSQASQAGKEKGASKEKVASKEQLKSASKEKTKASSPTSLRSNKSVSQLKTVKSTGSPTGKANI